jgi:hypothetical protein
MIKIRKGNNSPLTSLPWDSTSLAATSAFPGIIRISHIATAKILAKLLTPYGVRCHMGLVGSEPKNQYYE